MIRVKLHTITKTKKFGFRHQKSKSASTGSNQAAKPLKEEAKKIKNKTRISLPIPYMAMVMT